MSGMEVAGLVLGAIPILTMAFSEVRTRYRFFRHKALYIDRICDSLKDQQFLVLADLVSVLKAAGIPEKSISSVQSGQWEGVLDDAEVEAEVRDHLNQVFSKGYDRYVECLQRCEKSLAEIARCVSGLTGSDLHRVAADDSHGYLKKVLSSNQVELGGYFWVRTAQKVKFAIEKNTIDARLSDLDSASNMLRRLNIAATVSAVSLAPDSTSRKFGRLADILFFAGAYATLLYKAIVTTACCTCHTLHGINLFLENTPALLQKRKGVRPAFDIEISGSKGPSQAGLWHRGKIQVVEEEQTTELAEKEVKVVIQVDSSEPEKEEVKSLCDTLKTQESGLEGVALFLSSEGGLLASKHPASGNEDEKFTDAFMTLEEIIDIKGLNQVQRVKWNVGKRMTLAAMICAATVEYSTTCWLDAPWKSSSIYFPRVAKPGNKPDGMMLPFDTETPFLRRANARASDQPEQTAKAVLLDLGILLLELWHQQSIATFAECSELQLTSSFGSRYDAAKLWLDTEDDILPFYSDAVRRCIEGTFAASANLPAHTWDDAVLRKSVCENVLKPLCENCPQATRRRR